MAAHSASYAGLTRVSIHFHKELYAKMLDCRAGKFTQPAPYPVQYIRAIIGKAKAGCPWGEGKGRIILAQQVSDVFCKADVPAALGAPDYTIHSLRHTVASQMEGSPETTIALCLSHHYGPSGKSVTRSYIAPSAKVQRAREVAKLEPKRAAFDQWASRLREIIM